MKLCGFSSTRKMPRRITLQLFGYYYLTASLNWDIRLGFPYSYRSRVPLFSFRTSRHCLFDSEMAPAGTRMGKDLQDALIWIRYVPGVRAERGVSVASGARNFSILIDSPWLGVSST